MNGSPRARATTSTFHTDGRRCRSPRTRWTVLRRSAGPPRRPRTAVRTRHPTPGQTHTCPEGSEPARVRATGQPLSAPRHRRRCPADGVRPAMSAGHEPTPGAPGPHSRLLVPQWARGSPLGLAPFVRRQTADPIDDELLPPRRSPPQQRRTSRMTLRPRGRGSPASPHRDHPAQVPGSYWWHARAAGPSRRTTAPA